MLQWRGAAVGVLCFLSSAHAWAQEACGAPPVLSSVLANDESIKGQLKGQADFLTKLVGRAELGGEIEAARKQFYQSSDGFLAAQKDAYLAYMFCIIIMQDKSMDTMKKLQALQDFKAAASRPARTPTPALRSSNDEPVTMALVENEVHPLDGYQFAQKPVLPLGIAAGVVLPVGGRVRVVLQSTDRDAVTEIERIALISQRHELTSAGSLKYTVDPTKLSGFGSARPHSFNVRLLKEKAEISYVADTKTSVQARANDLLAATPAPLLRLDASAGLQETLNLVVIAADSGFYELRLVAFAVSGGKSYELKTKPLYVVRQSGS